MCCDLLFFSYIFSKSCLVLSRHGRHTIHAPAPAAAFSPSASFEVCRHRTAHKSAYLSSAHGLFPKYRLQRPPSCPVRRGAGGLARSLHLLQRYVLQSQQNTADDDCAAAAATTTAIETLCTHFLSCVTPNTSAQQLLISAVAAYILPFPAVAATCRRLSSNFAHRNHAITWVHTVMACLQSSPPPPPPSHGGRASMQLLIHQLLQVLLPRVPVSLSS